MSRALLALALCFGAGTSTAATLQTYVESGAGSNRRVLGYPVPLPVESQTAVAGFRSYASLHARHQALALGSADASAHTVGQTIAGRPVWAYVLSDQDDMRSDGEAEPAFLINGGIHAREWQSPEVVTAIFERVLAGAAGQGLDRYLLDETRIVIVPVLNVDGFLQTQRYPTEVLTGDDPRGQREWPRDGRMRRKNMRGVDENLASQGDHLGGIDLNRNHQPFWGGGASNPADLTYRGTAPGSEPESQALLAAAQLAPTSALRSYVDVHSFTRVLFVQNTGVPERDHVANSLAGLFIAAEAGYAGGRRFQYQNSPEPVNRGIGTTADHFAYTHQIPSWTLELEPGANGSVEYGGVGDSHDGFILPVSEIARVRDSVSQAQRLLFYRMSGPAWLRELRIIDLSDGSFVHDAGWVREGDARRLVARRSLGLRPGARYRLWLGFSKPMRLRRDGIVAPVPDSPALDLDLQPVVSLGAAQLAAGRWLDQPGPPGHGYLRWQDDAWSTEFVAPASAPDGVLALSVLTQDLSGEYNDSEPASPVRWSAGWTGFQESGAGDRSHRIALGEADRSALRLLSRPRQLGEGDRLRLSIARLDVSAPARLRVRASASGANAAAFVPLDSVLEIPASRSAVAFELVSIDDTLVSADATVRIQFEPLEGPLADRELELQLVDNDDPGRARLQVWGDGPDLAPNLAGALAMTNVAGRPVDVALARPALATSLPDGAATALPAITGQVELDARGALLQLPSGARAFDIASGARLALRDVRLLAPATHALAGDGGLVRNAGTLELRDADLVDGRARRGGQVANTGTALLERVRMVGGRADEGGAQLWSSGNLQLQQTALIGAASGNGALWSEGSSSLLSVSLVAAQASPALRRSAGALHAARSLLAGNLRNCEAGSGVVSDGANLDADGSCGLAAAASAPGYALASVADLPSPQPAGPALDAAGGECGARDLHGRARPQGGACDIGAVESGSAPTPGLWYDPARDSSGFAVELVGNLLFVVWYTYDAAGEPIAYTAQAPLRGSAWSAPLLRFTRAANGEVSNAAIGSLDLDFTAADRADASFEFAPGGRGTLRLQLLDFAPGAPALGVRGAWASADFAYQGFSLVDDGEVLAALAYFYDSAGALRWVLGTAQAHQAPSVDLLRFSGACPTCDYRLPTVAAAGTLDLQFEGRDRAALRINVEAVDRGGWRADTAIEAFR